MAEEKKLKDYSEECKEKIPLYVDPVKGDKAKLPDALTQLLALEKKARLAADVDSTKKLAAAILSVCKDCGAWKELNDKITLLCKRRAQLRKVIQAVIQDAVSYVESTPDKETKIALIETIRTVSEGKMFVELERARMTKLLAEIREEEGDVSLAAEILQEIQVETIGSMEAREKANFLLEQVRLCSAKKDFIRAEIVAKKVNVKVLNKEDFADLKMKYYKLMVELHLGKGEYLAIAKAYNEMFHTKEIQEDQAKWEPILEKAVVFLLLSPYDAEVSDLLARTKAEPKLQQLPACQTALEEFTLDELMGWPLKCEEQWKKLEEFQDMEKGEERWKDLRKMIMQHNIRVMAGYYTRITSVRLAGLLGLTEDETEKLLSEMVSSKQLFAKIDRPTGIITFDKKKNPNEIVNSWAADISTLLSLVDKTCHLINKEKMLHKIK